MEKEYKQNVRTPFDFSAGKTCFMEGTPLGLFLLFIESGCVGAAAAQIFCGASAVESFFYGNRPL